MESWDTWEEAFEFWLKNTAESDEYEQAKNAEKVIRKWLGYADKDIAELLLKLESKK